MINFLNTEILERLKERLLQSMSSLKSQFAKLDTTGDGILSKNELFIALENAGVILDEDDKESVWGIVDEDQVDFF